jgi:hypothetical protein
MSGLTRQAAANPLERRERSLRLNIYRYFDIPPVLPFLDNSSSTRTAWIVVFTPSSIGEVGDTAKSA